MQVVVPRLSTNGLRWHCSGDFVARQCLQFRGVLPVCADPRLGSPDGAILKAALQEVRVGPGAGVRVRGPAGLPGHGHCVGLRMVRASLARCIAASIAAAPPSAALLPLLPPPCVQANSRGLLLPGDRVVVSQCPRINDRFDVMAEAGVVKILTIGADGHTPDNPLVVTDAGMLRCTSRHVFGSQDAVHDCSDLV
jgi:hypothetical protein